MGKIGISTPLGGLEYAWDQSFTEGRRAKKKIKNAINSVLRAHECQIKIDALEINNLVKTIRRNEYFAQLNKKTMIKFKELNTIAIKMMGDDYEDKRLIITSYINTIQKSTGKTKKIFYLENAKSIIAEIFGEESRHYKEICSINLDHTLNESSPEFSNTMDLFLAKMKSYLEGLKILYSTEIKKE
ncbi:hypothetical protein NEF87_000095 [Candidatus Lokiarchaeum ossiferum]|uniref:Uncharacterized protein n=1 Tax=Candidatus Lokiarchaeum ossiferum TaxID=2951803 RepID=A0ABY6HJV4_9ARCH|nr:hypothetical protein NEF87_000095 [Candidatus Lokiarchaeum sp. B-35]